MSGLLNVGSTALMAAYTQMRTAGHNIANVNTPGFSRQDVSLATLPGSFGGAGFVGRGVGVETVQRRYDQFLTAEVAASAALAAADQARFDQLGRLDRLFADTDHGIGVAMDDLTAAMADVVNRPFDAASRTVVMNRAGTLAERFGGARRSLDELRSQVDLRLRDGVNRTNDALSLLAQINDKIAKVASGGQPPNDLLDQRDQLIETVNKQMKATGYFNADGTVRLFSASGQTLVADNTAAQLSLVADPLDPRKAMLSLKTLANDIAIDTPSLGGGELAGLLRYRDGDLAAIQGRLGQLAASIAQAYNEQQSLGRDSTGAVGAAMFETGEPAVNSSNLNVGNAVFSAQVSDATQLSTSDYELAFDGANWSATRLTDGEVLPIAGFPATFDGLQVSLDSGAASAGDRFLVRSATELANGFSMALPSAARLATGMAVTPQRGTANTGDLAVSSFRVISNDPNLTEAVTIQFTSATTFDVVGTGTGNPTGVTYTPGATISFNGWSMTLKGTPGVNDTVTLGATQNPAADNRNARELLGIADRLIVGGERPADAFGNLVADVGTRTQSAQVSLSLSTRTLNDAQASRAAVSGVNLDEEAARLLQFQQAYQAAAKVIATAQSVFDTLLQITA